MTLSGEFFLELGCEEIPARYLPDLCQDLSEKLSGFLVRNRLSLGEEGLREFYTARRLVYHVPHLSLCQTDLEDMVTGPPRKVAFDTAGVPTQAARSFADKNGVKVEKLIVINTAKGEYIAVRRVQKGTSATKILTAGLAEVVLSVSLPRAMYWNSQAGPSFIRPIRWICCLLDGKPLPFTLGEIKASRFSFGHRVLSPGKLPVRDFSSYAIAIKKSGVLLDPQERLQKIRHETNVLAKENSAIILQNNELINTHVCLSEHPSGLVGEFDAAFLKLPREILVTVMRDHQKCFSLLDEKKGTLLPRFLAIIDNTADHKGYIRKSQERVLRARLADAEFFWNADVKIPMEDRCSMLEKVVFQEKLGSYAEKSRRIELLALSLWKKAGILLDEGTLRKAAQLAKCDLTTQMVKEFTELQGVVGGLYAEAQGHSPEVSRAIYEHYSPQTLESPIPESILGCLLSIADRMDTITGSFALGHRPSGSKDPFGLRRLAYGILKVILEKKMSFDLRTIISESLELHSGIQGADLSSAQAAMLEFFRDHSAYVLSNAEVLGGEKGMGRDEVAAVLSTDCWDLVDLSARLTALHEIRARENFDSLAASFKRIKNIIRKSGVSLGGKQISVDSHLFEQAEEGELEAAIQNLKERIGHLQGVRDYTAILESVATIRPVVDRFFDKVLVNAEQEAVRANRFNLLLSLYQEFLQIADFSELQSASESAP